MFDFTHLLFEQLIIHRVGNKAREEGYFLSENCQSLEDDELQGVLFDFFFSSFTNPEQYRFHHPSDLRMNELYTFCQKLFEDGDNFSDISKHIAHHLYEQGDHPRIKSGELYIVHVKDCLIDDELVEAVGIFKSEQHQQFIRVNEDEHSLHVSHHEGIDARKLDKGVLVFNTLEEDGYMVKIMDALNRNADEARFWKEGFLGLAPIEDSVYSTKAYFEMARDFVEEVIATDEEVSKSERLETVNRAVSYFESEDDFEIESFTQKVFEKPEQQDNFKAFKKMKDDQAVQPLEENFQISEPVVKKEKRKVKHLISLDNSIQLKLNPDHQERNNEVIERGFDPERGLYYYKIYYEREA